ncbi:FAM92A isoform 11 [Pan troglodytes]|uniref:FAM92A isoform 11 n=3 Tax=Pan TaxID=9596 RepID=A0A6D2XHX2_PANTR|nr:FAM92A isoform 11 [Pan troglodytes]
MMRRTLENRNAQTKQLQTAVSNVEKHFGELCQIFAAYVRKTARLRDKADLLVNEINAYAATETPHLKLGLMNFADEFAKLQDYRQAENLKREFQFSKNRMSIKKIELVIAIHTNLKSNHIWRYFWKNVEFLS